MSRFLKNRHYRLVLPAINHLLETSPFPLSECIEKYLYKTGVSYTIQDIAEIHTLYLKKYGSKS